MKGLWRYGGARLDRPFHRDARVPSAAGDAEGGDRSRHGPFRFRQFSEKRALTGGKGSGRRWMVVMDAGQRVARRNT